jgi:multisubunit Na+/H+ antiporter MnhE subunit
MRISRSIGQEWGELKWAVMFVIGLCVVLFFALIITGVVLAHHVFEPHRQVEAGPHV